MNDNNTNNYNAEIEEAEEYVDDDIQLLELHKRLVMMKSDRKKAQQDASLLQNRLKMLKNEEDKTVKKIEVTRKKTQEIIVNKERQEEERLQKESWKEQKDMELERQKEKNLNLKNEIVLSTLEKKELKMRQIMEEARLLKEQKKSNDDMLRLIKEEEAANNKSKYEAVKKSQIHSEQKRKEIEIIKKNSKKNEIEEMIMQEMEMKEQVENNIAQMENEEIEVMKRLRVTTQVHSAMMDDYNSMKAPTSTSSSGSKLKSQSPKRGNYNKP